ncbi:hypothetical protein GCM10007923_65030 [Shinella yambaruensis]|uniref:Uncharacterized protein n=1 Tax=Shinella yambaruensis TaxID=415996 RepID=A0ABQ5ZU51_9HYPH|nr:hypothetical protein GCM10007923_65030 [Shinella yambaruensis]
MSHLFCPDAPKRSGRAAPKGAAAAGLAELRSVAQEEKDVFTKTNEGSSFTSFSKHARSMRIRSRMAALAPL